MKINSIPAVSIKTHDDMTASLDVLCNIANEGRQYPSTSWSHLRNTAIAAVRHLENRGFTATAFTVSGEETVVVEDYGNMVTLVWDDNEGYIVKTVEQKF
jgi:hypothetical protein